MGLDLILENRNRAIYGNDEWHELAYGRKTWVIADFFRDRNEAIDGDWLYHVSRESWDEFMAIIHPYMTNADFLTAFKHCLDFEWENSAPQPTAEERNRLKALLRKLSSDGWAQLGDVWEIDAIFRWYNSNNKIQDAFNRGDGIRLVVSY